MNIVLLCVGVCACLYKKPLVCFVSSCPLRNLRASETMTADASSKDDKKFYANYLVKVKSCVVELPCPLCKLRLLPRNFEAHFLKEHLHSQSRCLWCARYEHSWAPFQLTRHLHKCFTQLLNSALRETIAEDAGNNYHSISPLTFQLRQFQKKISTVFTSPYPCPHRGCLEWVKPGDMERHFKNTHAPFDPSTACIWCDGAFVWPRLQKNCNVEHLSRCFETYSEKVKQNTLQTEPMDETTTEEEDSIDSSPVHFSQISCGCPSMKGNMWGRWTILPDYAYGHLFMNIDFTVFPERKVFNLIEFEDVVERPRFYLDLFCQWNNVSDGDDGAYDSDDEEDEQDEMVATWYHVMVSAFALDRFVRAVREFGENKVFTLPYWCWCDGGPYNREIFYQHRHMILVVRNGCRFKELCWNKFCRVEDAEVCVIEKVEDYSPPTPPLSPPEGFIMGLLRRIRSWLHLVVTMKDLSVCQSHCRYDFKGQHVKKREKRWGPLNNHFCFGEDWHCLGIPSLVCVTSQNGIKGLLDQEERMSQLPRLWEPRLCFSRWPENGGPWHVRVGDVKHDIHKVLPVKKEWRPTQITSPGEHLHQREKSAFFYLMERKKLLFEKDPSLVSLSDDEWLRVQAGEEAAVVKNLFFDVVADARWKVGPFLQRSLDFGEKYAQEKIESALAEKTKEWEIERQKERDEEARQHEEKERVWAAKETELRKEMESYKQRSEARNNGGGQVTVNCDVSHIYYQTST